MLASMSSTVCYKQARPRMLGRTGGKSNKEPVVKNPLSPVEHPGGVGVNCELFELGVEQFVVSHVECFSSCSGAKICSCRLHLFRIE